MTINFKILESNPISGKFDEKHFGETDTNPLWIRFNSNDSSDWVGSFASGNIGLSNIKIIEIDNTSKVGILTNGAFYLINRSLKELIFKPDQGYFTDFYLVPDTELLILATNWGIHIFKDKEIIKEIRPDFVDGVKFIKRKENLLTGEICEPTENGDDWSEFELNIQTLKLKWKKYDY